MHMATVGLFRPCSAFFLLFSFSDNFYFVGARRLRKDLKCKIYLITFPLFNEFFGYPSATL